MRKTQTRILSLLLVLSLCIGLLAASGLKLTAKAAETITLDFTNIDDFSSWTSAYQQHELTDSSGVKVVFEKANRQSGTITDMPVTKGQPVTVIAPSDKVITNIELICKQWGSKAQTIYLQYSTDGGTTFQDTDPKTSSSDFTVKADLLPNGTNAVKFTFYSQDNQIGIQSCTLTLASIEEVCEHEFDAGTVTLEPTCTEEGVKTLTCTKCGATKTETIEALGHDIGADGKCTRCDYDSNKVYTIAEALAAENDTVLTNVTGVVTFTNVSSGNTNIYIQDAEGKNGICLFFKGTELTIYNVGDTVTVKSGTRAAYNGLPELEVTEDNIFKSSENIELKANDVTIDELTESMLCTYVHLTDLEVTEVYDKDGAYTYANITVKDTSEKTIQIYMAIMDKTTVGVGDTLDFTGALSIYNTTLQLRNTLNSEIKILSKATTTDPTETTEPTDSTEPSDSTGSGDSESNTYVLATEVKDGDQIILVNVAYNKAISAETNDSGYLLGVDVTPNSSKITTSNANIVWTVKVVDGGYQLVNADGKTISCTSGLGYGDSGNVWVFEFDGNTLQIRSATEKGDTDYKYIEWYDKYSDFSTYYLDNADASYFAMNVYVLDPDATPVTPSGIPGTADSSRLVLAGVVMVMAVAAAAALVTQRKRFF